MTLSNVLFVSKTSELKKTLQKYKYQGWGICLACVLSEPGYAYKRYAYKKKHVVSRFRLTSKLLLPEVCSLGEWHCFVFHLNDIVNLGQRFLIFACVLNSKKPEHILSFQLRGAR